MFEWFKTLPGSDQRALILGGAAVIGASAWFLLISPLHMANAVAESRKNALLEIQQRVLAIQGNVERLGGIPEDRLLPFLKRVQEIVADTGNTTNVTVEQGEGDSVQIRADSMDYRDFVQLMLAFEESHLSVVSGYLQQKDSDGIKASITLKSH